MTLTLNRLVLIVGATSERNVLGRRFTALGERHEVVELQESGRSAMTLAVSDKAASTAITLPNHALHFSGNRA